MGSSCDASCSLRVPLRSQLRAAATDWRGTSGLEVDTPLCTNDLADGERLDYEMGEACIFSSVSPSVQNMRHTHSLFQRQSESVQVFHVMK